MPRLSPETQQARRRHILDAAARCFERDGFHATTIPDICREAGVSTGAIYTWFPNKSAIVASLAAASHDRRRDLLEQWSTPEELADGLVTVVAGLRGTSAARLDVHLWSGALTDDALRHLAVASFEQSISGMADVLGNGQRSSADRGLAGLLLAAVIGIEVMTATGAADIDATIAAFGTLLRGDGPWLRNPPHSEDPRPEEGNDHDGHHGRTTG